MSTDNDILIDNYLRGLLTEEELIAFELKLQSDDEFRRNVALEQALWSSQNDADWSFATYKNDEIKTYIKLLEESDLQNLKKSLKQINSEFNEDASKSRSYKFYYLAAASIAILITLSVFFNQDVSNQELVDKYLSTADLPSLVSRGHSEADILIQAQELFENENYQDALNIFRPALETRRNDPSIYLYTGIAQMKLMKFTEAEITFDNLVNSQLLDAQKGYWYKALLFLEQNRIDETKVILNTIISNSLFNHDEAEELLKALSNE